ncbi:MAG: hypothetical protein IT260_06095 [Saprospiraceae bacterium]|nr:hypothetical protein [Saprospiraceae bacterium]
MFEKFSAKKQRSAVKTVWKALVAAGFPKAKKNGEPKQAFDKKEEKTKHAKAADPRFPVFFFHVQSII